MDDKTQKEFNILRGLIQYKDKDDAFIERKALENIKKKELEVEMLFENEEEKHKAMELYTKYLQDNSFENSSDLNTLKTLVYNEIFQLRLQKIINIVTAELKSVPDKSIKALIDCQKQISELKKELGLVRDDNDKSDAYKALETLQKKFRVYQLENKDEFTCRCPSCQEMIMWNRRIKDYDAKKHPLIKNNKPYNIKVVQLIRDGKITKRDASDILECSESYIDYILEKSI